MSERRREKMREDGSEGTGEEKKKKLKELECRQRKGVKTSKKD
jgi:hypothetical protein